MLKNRISLLTIIILLSFHSYSLKAQENTESIEIDGKKYKNQEEYFDSPEYRLSIQKAEDTEEYYPYGGKETKETKNLYKKLAKKHQKRKIYKNKVKCENPLSFTNTIECLIVNWSDILYNDYKETEQMYIYYYAWAVGDIAQDSDTSFLDSIKYNDAPYYYVQAIRDVTLLGDTPFVYLRVFIGKEELEDGEPFLLLELEKESDDKYFLSRTFIETGINTPTKPYKFPE